MIFSNAALSPESNATLNASFNSSTVFGFFDSDDVPAGAPSGLRCGSEIDGLSGPPVTAGALSGPGIPAPCGGAAPGSGPRSPTPGPASAPGPGPEATGGSSAKPNGSGS